MMAILKNETKNQDLIPDLKIARGFLQRGVGLISKSSLGPHEGLWIGKCRSIHTFFMSFAIDCVFVDKKLRVKALVENIKPWRVSRIYWAADSVIELQAGSIRRLNIEVGDQLNVVN